MTLIPTTLPLPSDPCQSCGEGCARHYTGAPWRLWVCAECLTQILGKAIAAAAAWNK